jgi:heptosyltransferase-1
VNTKGWRHSLASPDTWRQISGSISDIRTSHYDVAIDFQGALRSATLARFSGAKEIYGFANPREKIAKLFYSSRANANGTHVIEQNLSLAETFFGSRLKTSQPELPRDNDAEQECNSYLTKHQIAKFVLLNPGAGWGAKQWPADRYGEVARRLSEDGLRCLVNYGPGEQALAEKVETSSAGSARSIQLSLTQLIAFTRRATLFIAGDTGPLHLAAALGVPVVAIFGPTNPSRNGPFGTTAVVLRSPLSNTSHKRRPQPDEALLTISVEQVVAAARKLLGKPLG